MIVEAELTIPANLKEEPLIYNIIKEYEIIPNILEASFSTDVGWAIIRFQGKSRELKKLFSFLKKEKGIKLNFT